MTKKTYKRELAVALLMWLGYLVETKEPELVEILVFPIFTFTALAYGMSWYSPNGGLLRKSSQFPNRGRPQRGGEYSSRGDQYSDSGDYPDHRTETSETPSANHQPDRR